MPKQILPDDDGYDEPYDPTADVIDSRDVGRMESEDRKPRKKSTKKGKSDGPKEKTTIERHS
jgi:hypothetical protein